MLFGSWIRKYETVYVRRQLLGDVSVLSRVFLCMLRFDADNSQKNTFVHFLLRIEKSVSEDLQVSPKIISLEWRGTRNHSFFHECPRACRCNRFSDERSIFSSCCQTSLSADDFPYSALSRRRRVLVLQIINLHHPCKICSVQDEVIILFRVMHNVILDRTEEVSVSRFRHVLYGNVVIRLVSGDYLDIIR